MSVRNLEFLFKPSSIALIGASRRPQSVGAAVARNLFTAGFEGPVMPVNPRERSIASALAYASVAELPVAPDLAVICTPPETVPGLISELGARGTKAAVVVTAGFGEQGAHGRELQQAALSAAQPHLLRILGPNCLGVMVPGRGLNASFVHVPPLAGDLAFVSQSGAVVTSVVDWATARKIGFSHFVSLGDMIDVDFGDVLDYLARDAGTRAILLYVEAVTHARKFMSAARAASRTKPVIVIKAGRSEEAARAAATHTGALAGSDDVYEAAFRRAGMLRVGELDELFDAVETLASGLSVTGDRLAILTNGGGIGVLATDTLVAQSGRLATLSAETIGQLDAILPKTWSHGNPVDIIGDAGPDRYRDTLRVLLRDRESDAVLVLNCPTAVSDSLAAASAVTEVVEHDARPVLTSWLGETAAHEPRQIFAEHRIPTYETPDKAARAFMHLAKYRRNQSLLTETPPSVPELFDVDAAAARSAVAASLGGGRAWMTEPEAKQVLHAYRIPVVETLTAASADEAARLAAEIGKPVALKILSPDITHKSDLGGVALNLTSADEVRHAAEAMLIKVQSAAPKARLDGFTVQQMAGMPGAPELIVGAFEDVLFGPVILFGHGGTAVEVIRDRALALPPLNLHLARDMMARTRVYPLLLGYRSQPAAALDEIATTLMKISQLVIDIPEVAELDINPLLADAAGVLALDARIRVAPPALAGAGRLAIRPYPKHLEKLVRIPDGPNFLLRPIRPEDEPLVRAMAEQTMPEDLRLRFFAPLQHLSPQLAARLTQIDYDREMAFVAVTPAGGDGVAILGVVHLSADPDNIEAEYAVIVRSDMKGRGLGYLLMQEIIGYARQRGIRLLRGSVLRENTTMLQMCEELGFARHARQDEPSVIEVVKELGQGAS